MLYITICHAIYYYTHIYIYIIYIYIYIYIHNMKQISRNIIQVTYYGSVPNTMYSLLMAVTGGADWENVVAPLSEISYGYQLLFALYVLFIVVGMLNVMTSVRYSILHCIRV